MYSFQKFCCLTTDHPPPVETTANCLRAACPFIAYYLLVRLLLFCLSLYNVRTAFCQLDRCSLSALYMSSRAFSCQYACYYCIVIGVVLVLLYGRSLHQATG